MLPSPHHADGAEAAIVASRSPARSRRREEVEAGAGGGAREVEAEEGVSEGDGEAREEALVDLGLAGAEEAGEVATPGTLLKGFRASRTNCPCRP